MASPQKSSRGAQAPLAAAGAMALVAVCCGGHLLLLGALGGLALGSALGIGAGVLAALLTVGAFIAIRRRRMASCHTEPERSLHR